METRESTQRFTIKNALIARCGKNLTADLIEELAKELSEEMESGPTSWAFKESKNTREHQAAVDTLTMKGYTWNGGELWRPPLGKKPDFDAAEQALSPEVDKAITLVATRFAQAALEALTPRHTMEVSVDLSHLNDADLAKALGAAPPFAMGGTLSRRKDVFEDVPVILPRNEPHPAHAALADATFSYADAFYKLAELLNLGAQPLSPREVFEQQIYPRYKDMVAREKPVRWFRMQHGPHIPWEIGEILYAGYAAAHGTSQSMERVNERGGFGWGEIAYIAKDRPAVWRAMEIEAKRLGIGLSR